MGMIQIMLKEVRDQSLIQYLDICKSSGLLLSGLVNSIVDLNLIRARKFKVNPEKVELRHFIKEILHLFEFQCSQKGIYLKSKLTSLLPIYITTDKDRLSQIFINLLSNSLKFTNTGGITIFAKTPSNKDYIEFTVEDTGLGIKPHDKERLLIKGSSRLNPQGVGLGLTVSESLVRLLGHQGEGLVVASEENKGCRMSFLIKKSLRGELSRGSFEGILPGTPEYFPSPPIPSTKEVGDVNNRMQNYCSKLKRVNTLQLLTETASKNILNDSESNNPSKGFLTSQLSSPLKPAQGPNRQYTFGLQKETPCVLIVDDNPLNIMVAEHLVSSHKFKVKTALSGHIALDVVLKNNHVSEPIKLIIMDCQMPVMDGYETTRSLKDQMKLQNIPEIPIIALTANDSEADKEACKQAGMSEHLTKPLKDKELVRILKKYCGYIHA